MPDLDGSFVLLLDDILELLTDLQLLIGKVIFLVLELLDLGIEVDRLDVMLLPSLVVDDPLLGNIIEAHLGEESSRVDDLSQTSHTIHVMTFGILLASLEILHKEELPKELIQ